MVSPARAVFQISMRKQICKTCIAGFGEVALFVEAVGELLC